MDLKYSPRAFFLIFLIGLTSICIAAESMYRINYGRLHPEIKNSAKEEITEATKRSRFSIEPGISSVGTSRMKLDKNRFVSLIDRLIKEEYFRAQGNSGIVIDHRRIEDNRETITIIDEGRSSVYADHPGISDYSEGLKLSFIYHKITQEIKVDMKLNGQQIVSEGE